MQPKVWGQAMGTSRLEAFSDGVLAVAITLLVLDLRVDRGSTEGLSRQLAGEWPSLLGYAVSFFVLGIIWVNHHALLAFTQRVDRGLLFYNLLLLLWATTIPFTTSTLAMYMRDGGDNAHVAVLAYGATSEGMALSFTAMLRHILRHDLSSRPVSPAEARRRLVRFGFGIVLYPAATIVGLYSIPAMLGCYALISAFYIFEQTPTLGGRRGATPAAGGADSADVGRGSDAPLPAAVELRATSPELIP
jgi:uncharacterized membrane protein